jgi:hypothetical protein
VLEGWEIPADLRLRREVDISDDAPLSARQPSQDSAPVIHNHAVAIGLTSIGVKSRLGWGKDVAQILYGASA